MEHYFITKSALEATAEERERVFDQLWDHGGFAFPLANYQDLLFNQAANDLISDYLRRKIRQAVKDPAVAEKLVPKGYPYATKRPPLDTNYYETFNKDNVLLVDANTDGLCGPVMVKRLGKPATAGRRPTRPPACGRPGPPDSAPSVIR